MKYAPDPHLWLRSMVESDLELVLSWRNHPDIRKYMYTQDYISFEEHLRWFKDVSVDLCYHLLILEIDSVPRGFVNFRCDGAGAATWGFYLAPGSPRGLGRLLGEATTGYAFKVLGLERIWGEVLFDNLASQNFHLHQGFMLENMLSVKTADGQTVGDAHRYLLTRNVWKMRQGVIE